jgi:hypothetical protein
MYDVHLPGHPLGFAECPLCEARPVPENAYSYTEANVWREILLRGDRNEIHAYLKHDLQTFQHSDYDGKPCPAEILPGVALRNLSGYEARVKAAELLAIISPL